MLEPSQSDVPTLHCTQCSYEAAWMFELDHHIQRNHKNVYADRYHALLEPELYPCVCCSFKSYYKLSQYEHCTNQHDPEWIKQENTETCQFYDDFKRFSCDFCPYDGHSSAFLIVHLLSCQMVPKLPSTSLTKVPAENETNDFQCTQCPYKGGTKFMFEEHLLIHEADRLRYWHKCTKCPVRVKHKRSMKVHMLTHAADEDIVWFNCSECSYRTTTKGVLNRHMLTQHVPWEEVVSFNCDKCPYRTRDKRSLKRHAMTHASFEEIEWFRCDKCCYLAKQKGNLKRHMMKYHASPPAQIQG